MKWSSHCPFLMSTILAAQYHRLVTAPTRGTARGCFVECPGCLHSTSCPAGCMLPVHSWVLPQALLLARRADLAPGSIFLQRPVNVEAQRPGPLASSWQSSEGSSQLHGFLYHSLKLLETLVAAEPQFNLSLHPVPQPFLPHWPIIP